MERELLYAPWRHDYINKNREKNEKQNFKNDCVFCHQTSLNEDEKLRGCIGYIEPIEKLYKAVQLNALSAAFDDPRFSPLSENELKNVKIEISILTIPNECEFKNIKQNIDGVVLKNGRNGATYLPQVWEDIESEEEFFGSLCNKAGLEWNCYKDKNTKFSTYQAEVFSE